MQKLGDKRYERETIIFVFSNLREMDWIRAVISDTSINFDISIVSLYPNEQAWVARLKSPNVFVTNIQFNKPKDIFRVAIGLFKDLGRNKSRLIVAHGFYSSIAAIIAGKLRFKTRIVTVRHHGRGHYETPVLYRLDRFISHFSHRVVAISELTKKLLLSEGVPTDKIIVIPNAIDVLKFSTPAGNPREVVLGNFGFNDSHFVIGVLSRFVDWKGIRYSLEAFSRILETNPEARLVLVNSNAKNDLLDGMIEKIGHRYIFKIDEVEDIPAFYSSLDVFVHTPISFDAEPFGLVYLEGLASGTNCIFTLSGVALDLEQLERFAWLVDYNSAKEIENSINLVIQGESREKIPADYLSDFTIESYLRQFREFINNVL